MGCKTIVRDLENQSYFNAALFKKYDNPTANPAVTKNKIRR